MYRVYRTNTVYSTADFNQPVCIRQRSLLVQVPVSLIQPIVGRVETRAQLGYAVRKGYDILGANSY